MHTVLMAILLVVSVLMIIAILLQSSNSSGLSGSMIAGGAEQLFGKRKSRGYDSILARITVVLAVVYIVAALAIVTLFN